MLITVLVISACLANNPKECRDFVSPLAENITATQCFMTSPIQISLWQQQNPIWQFRRVTCETGTQGPDGSIIRKQNI